MRWSIVALVVALVAFVAPAYGESVDVEAAMARALAHHPITDEDAAGVRVAEARVAVERSKYWPDLELFVQLDRTTANVVNGALFAVPNLPVVAGTPGRTFDSGHTGTAGGVTVAWDALGYKRWDAAIEEARQAVRVARADADARRLDVAYTAADKLIAAVARDEEVRAARAGVDRAQVFVTTVKAAVDQNLRPGADLSRADAELAFAKTALVRAEAGRQVALVQLAEALGEPGAAITVTPGRLGTLPPRPTLATAPGDPRLVATAARIAAAHAREDVVATGYWPHVNLVGALWARGNDLEPDGRLDGFLPDVPNWAVGVAVTWPVLAGKTVGPQREVERANIARAEAAQRVVREHVASQLAQATAILDGAYRISDNTPIALKAAREAEAQATARYQAKLVTADDVAQAQRLLEQAEIDDAVARLDVWRAILLSAYAAGDLAGFTSVYRKASP
jgi:outer membrane protein